MSSTGNPSPSALRKWSIRIAWLLVIFAVINYGILGHRIPWTHTRYCIGSGILTDQHMADRLHIQLLGTLERHKDEPEYAELKQDLVKLIDMHIQCVSKLDFNECAVVRQDEKTTIPVLSYEYQLHGEVLVAQIISRNSIIWSINVDGPGCGSTNRVHPQNKKIRMN